MGYSREVAQDIFLIELNIPLSVLTVNCYLIVGGNDVLLVDAGIFNADCFNQLLQGMKSLGLELRNLTGVVVTHAHLDHFGLASQLQQFTSAAIYLHFKDRMLMHAQLQNLITEKEGAKWLRENGVSEKEITLFKQNFSDYTQYITSLVPNTWLKGGEIISLPGKTIEVIWTPGHTSGHVCLYVHERSVLFVGDHILKEGTTHVGDFWWTKGNPLQDYFSSLEKVTNLNPKLILPAHGRSFKDVKKRCKEIKDYRLVRNKRLISSLGFGRKNAWELVKDLWGDALDLQNKRLALADVLAHLKYLHVKGLVQCQKSKNILYWQLN